MVAEKFKFMVLRLLANTFASQKIESVYFYLCHQAKLSPKFLSLRTYPYSIFCMGKLMIRNHINWCNYKRQRNHCLSILRKTKKEYFNSLNIKQVSDNKPFWKSVKPFFSDKGSNSSKITLVEENNIISDEEEIANIMNNYFINVTKTLNLKKQLGLGRSGVNEFENHISIKMIHEKYPEILPESFKFQFVSNNEVKKRNRKPRY